MGGANHVELHTGGAQDVEEGAAGIVLARIEDEAGAIFGRRKVRSVAN